VLAISSRPSSEQRGEERHPRVSRKWAMAGALGRQPRDLFEYRAFAQISTTGERRHPPEPNRLADRRGDAANASATRATRAAQRRQAQSARRPAARENASAIPGSSRCRSLAAPAGTRQQPAASTRRRRDVANSDICMAKNASVGTKK
jgi:hypothetical protein